MGLFDPRVNCKPYEYPEALKFVEAIQSAYWTHRQFTFREDIQDFKVNISEGEREILSRSFLLISQVEVAVKTYWSVLNLRMPKPEIGLVGATFGDSEVRHFLAYSHLLELLGLNEDFEGIFEIPAVIDRHNYLKKYQSFTKSDLNYDFFKSLLLFSLFIENVSLFGQFLIIKSFEHHNNTLKDVASVVNDTSKEELVHANFGIWLINTIKEEYPEFWSQDTIDFVIDYAKAGYEAEMKVIDWVFENHTLDFLPKSHVQEFLKSRFNTSLSDIGIEPIFETDDDILETLSWYNTSIWSTDDVDFFSSVPGAYSRHNKAFDTESMFEDDLFD